MVRRGPAEIPHATTRCAGGAARCADAIPLLSPAPSRRPRRPPRKGSSPSWPVSPPAHGPRRLRGALALSTLPVRMLTACRRADAAADTASGRQRQHPVCAKLRLHERWEFLLEQVRRAQLSILSSRCDTHLMNLRSFCSSSSRKTHLFFSKSLICMAMGKIHLY